MDLKNISHYQILRLVGSGGMGEVYLAEDPRLRRKVAIKVLKSDVAIEDERARRFAKEARAASALSHPNILTVFDVGETEGHRYIVTEFVEGQTLREYAEGGSPPIRRSAEIMLKVANALDAAHRSGIVHRDVKPDNIMIRRDGEVKVLDFGLAKLTAPAGHETSLIVTTPGMIMGTPKYMSPEQVRGFEVDRTSDVFSFGIVFYELLAGLPPFDGSTVSDMIVAVLTKDPEPLSVLAPTVPRSIEEIVEKCLRKDCSARYAGMARVIFDLERAIDTGLTPDINITAAVNGGPAARPAFLTDALDRDAETIPLPSGVYDTRRRSLAAVVKEPPIPTMLIAAVLVAVLAAFVVWLASRDRTPPGDELALVGNFADPDSRNTESAVPGTVETAEDELKASDVADVKAYTDEARELNVPATLFDDRQRKALVDRPGEKGVYPKGLIVPPELNGDGVVKQKAKLAEMVMAGYRIPMDFPDMARMRFDLQLVEIPMATRSYYLDVGGSASDAEFTSFDFGRGPTALSQNDFKVNSLRMMAMNFSGVTYDLNDPSDRQQMRRRLLRMLHPRAWTMLERVAGSYYKKFGRPLRIVSLTRPVDYQIELSKSDKNEYVVRDETSLPPHSSGCAIDIARKHMPVDEQNFVMEELARMERDGSLDALVMFGESASFHMFVYADGRPPSGS